MKIKSTPNDKPSLHISLKISGEALKEAWKLLSLMPTNTGVLSSVFCRIMGKPKSVSLSLCSTAMVHLDILHLPDAQQSQSGWEFFVDRKILGAFSESCTVRPVTLAWEGKQMRMYQGSRVAYLDAPGTIQGYGEWDKKGDPVQLSSSIVQILGAATKFAPTTAAVDHLNCIYLVQGDGIYSTDSFCIFYSPCTKFKASFPCPLLVPQAAVLVKTKAMELFHIGKNGVGVVMPNGYIYQPVSSKCRTDFPLSAVRKTVQGAQHGSEGLFLVSAERLKNSLTYLSGFSFVEQDASVVTCHYPGMGQPKPRIELQIDSGQGAVKDKIPILRCVDKKAQQQTWSLFHLRRWADYVCESEGTETKIFVRRMKHATVFTSLKNSVFVQSEIVR